MGGSVLIVLLFGWIAIRNIHSRNREAGLMVIPAGIVMIGLVTYYWCGKLYLK